MGTLSVGIFKILNCILIFPKAQQTPVVWEPTSSADSQQAASFFPSATRNTKLDAEENTYTYCSNIKELLYGLWTIPNGHRQRREE